MKNIKKWEIFINEEFGSNDNDLGKQILEYLKEYPIKYKTDTDLKKKDITRVEDSNRFYFFSKKIFFEIIEKKDIKTGKKIITKKSTGEYRIDVVMVSNEKNKLHTNPYQIYISNISKESDIDASRGGDIGVLRNYKPMGWRSRLGKNIGNISTDESKILNLDKNLSKNIYEETEKVWSMTNKNVKGSARGDKGPESKNIWNIKKLFKWK
jgi:hypothetical protein